MSNLTKHPWAWLLSCALVGALALALCLPLGERSSVISKGPEDAYGATAIPTYTIYASKPATAKADSVTVIGDSVPLGAYLFADMDGRIASQKGISWCKVDAKGSRQLAAGVSLAKGLKAKGKLGSIVVLALATNSSYDYAKAKAAYEALGKGRNLVFVTGYYRGDSYTNKSRSSALKLAKRYSNVYVADWYKFISAKADQKLSDHCHLTRTSGKWYGDVVIAAIKQVRADETARAQKSLLKSVSIARQGNLYLGMGSQVQAPIALAGAYLKGCKVKWSSADQRICRVDSEGLLTAVSPGQTTITLMKTSSPSKRSSIKVNVVSAWQPTTSGVLKKIALASSKKPTLFKLLFMSTPDNATGVTSFQSSAPAVATVNAAGVVVGRKAGTCTISASRAGIKLKAKVIVK